MRHLALEFPDDPTVVHIEDQFLCGRSLLLAPILDRDARRRVYLPPGGWHDFHTGERLEGPQWIEREWPIETFPLFVRAGAVLPLAPVVQHTGELDYQRLTLVCALDDDAATGQIATPGGGTLGFEVRHRADGLHVRTSRPVEHLTAERPGGETIRIAAVEGL